MHISTHIRTHRYACVLHCIFERLIHSLSITHIPISHYQSTHASVHVSHQYPYVVVVVFVAAVVVVAVVVVAVVVIVVC